MLLFDPEKYSKALRFAAEAHGDQKVFGTYLPYLTHVSSFSTRFISLVCCFGSFAYPPATLIEIWQYSVLCCMIRSKIRLLHTNSS